jgi:hypothetical protein
MTLIEAKAACQAERARKAQKLAGEMEPKMRARFEKSAVTLTAQIEMAERWEKHPPRNTALLSGAEKDFINAYELFFPPAFRFSFIL